MNIKDVLHFYIGAVKYRNRYIDYRAGEWTVWANLTPLRYAQMMTDLSVTDIEIRVRPLSSMDEKEAIVLGDVSADHFMITNVDRDEIGIYIRFKWPDENFPDGFKHSATSVYFNNKIWTVPHIQFLLSCGFDLFDLIPHGLALDATTISEPVNKQE